MRAGFLNSNNSRNGSRSSSNARSSNGAASSRNTPPLDCLNEARAYQRVFGGEAIDFTLMVRGCGRTGPYPQWELRMQHAVGGVMVYWREWDATRWAEQVRRMCALVVDNARAMDERALDHTCQQVVVVCHMVMMAINGRGGLQQVLPCIQPLSKAVLRLSALRRHRQLPECIRMLLIGAIMHSLMYWNDIRHAPCTEHPFNDSALMRVVQTLLVHSRAIAGQEPDATHAWLQFFSWEVACEGLQSACSVLLQSALPWCGIHQDVLSVCALMLHMLAVGPGTREAMRPNAQVRQRFTPMLAGALAWLIRPAGIAGNHAANSIPLQALLSISTAVDRLLQTPQAVYVPAIAAVSVASLQHVYRTLLVGGLAAVYNINMVRYAYHIHSHTSRPQPPSTYPGGMQPVHSTAFFYLLQLAAPVVCEHALTATAALQLVCETVSAFTTGHIAAMRATGTVMGQQHSMATLFHACSHALLFALHGAPAAPSPQLSNALGGLVGKWLQVQQSTALGVTNKHVMELHEVHECTVLGLVAALRASQRMQPVATALFGSSNSSNSSKVQATLSMLHTALLAADRAPSPPAVCTLALQRVVGGGSGSGNSGSSSGSGSSSNCLGLTSSFACMALEQVQAVLDQPRLKSHWEAVL